MNTVQSPGNPPESVSVGGDSGRFGTSSVERFLSLAMAVAASVKFESHFRWGNNSLVEKREEFPFRAPFDQAKSDKVLDIAFDVHAIMGLGDLDQFLGGTSERTGEHAAILINRLGRMAAGARKDAGLNGRDLAEQRHKPQIALQGFIASAGGSQEAGPIVLYPVGLGP